MQTLLLLWIVGVLTVPQLNELKQLWIVAAAIFLIAVLILIVKGSPLVKRKTIYGLATFTLGVVWSSWCYYSMQLDQLPVEFDGQTLWVEGRINGLPAIKSIASGQTITHFELEDAKSRRVVLPKKIRLSWYNAPEINAGEQWRLAVKLKSANGLLNKHVFDYEKWLFSQGVGANGTVKTGTQLDVETGLAATRDRARQRLVGLMPEKMAGGILALTLGDGSALSQEQWQILRNTGTIHLMVISGQHISLVAGLIYSFVVLLFRRGYWPASISWLGSACWLAFIGALAYGLLAGMGVPIQRALIMTAIVLFWRWRFSSYSVFMPLLFSMALVLAVNPLVILQQGFWLSYAAVFALALVFSRRLHRQNKLSILIHAQWAATLGLLPIMLLNDLPQSLSSPVANLIAIPWVSLLVLPLSLIAALLGLVGASFLAQLLFAGAGFFLDQLIQLLGLIAEHVPVWTGATYYFSSLSYIFAVIAVLGLLLPKHLLNRGMLTLLLLPLLFPKAGAITEGIAKITVMDVGQGQAILIETAQHAMLYDAAPALGGRNLGEQVVYPVLQSKGINTLDLLLVSHSDLDHSGGKPYLAKHLNIQRIVSGQPENLHEYSCENKSWQWDSVLFSQWQWLQGTTSNQLSCVLLVETAHESMLILGDLDQQGERAWLAQHSPEQVRWLVLGHHGSKTSTSKQLLESIAPEYGIISRGRYNTYGHPHREVKKNLEQQQVKVYDTALHGAIEISLGHQKEATYARQEKRIWRKNEN